MLRRLILPHSRVSFLTSVRLVRYSVEQYLETAEGRRNLTASTIFLGFSCDLMLRLLFLLVTFDRYDETMVILLSLGGLLQLKVFHLIVQLPG